MNQKVQIRLATQLHVNVFQEACLLTYRASYSTRHRNSFALHHMAGLGQLSLRQQSDMCNGFLQPHYVRKSYRSSIKILFWSSSISIHITERMAGDPLGQNHTIKALPLPFKSSNHRLCEGAVFGDAGVECTPNNYLE